MTDPHFPTAEHARLAEHGMYRPDFEGDACGVGLVAAAINRWLATQTATHPVQMEVQ